MVGANVRIEGADVRIEGADVRIEGADVRIEGADVRIEGADVRIQGADVPVETACWYPFHTNYFNKAYIRIWMLYNDITKKQPVTFQDKSRTVDDTK